MLELKDIKIKLVENNLEIISGVDLTIKPGEVHVINGKNGSGKSTLVNAIMGNPLFEITSGSLRIIDEKYDEIVIEKIDEEHIKRNSDTFTLDLTEMDANERSLAGIFLANQYPMEIPGVSLSSYLRLIYNLRIDKKDQLPVFKFKKLLEERAALINFPPKLLKRNLNEGFSGGEKKKTEILQMLIIEPRYILLDEIDSGLDKHSVREVFEALVQYKKSYPSTSFIVISHYEKVLEYFTPDKIHEMENGRFI